MPVTCTGPSVERKEWDKALLFHGPKEGDAEIGPFLKYIDKEREVLGNIRARRDRIEWCLRVGGLERSFETPGNQRLLGFEEFRKHENCDHLTVLSELIDPAEANDLEEGETGFSNNKAKITRNIVILVARDAATWLGAAFSVGSSVRIALSEGWTGATGGSVAGETV
jgi:hypothetical protein